MFFGCLLLGLKRTRMIVGGRKRLDLSEVKISELQDMISKEGKNLLVREVLIGSYCPSVLGGDFHVTFKANDGKNYKIHYNIFPDGHLQMTHFQQEVLYKPRGQFWNFRNSTNSTSSFYEDNLTRQLMGGRHMIPKEQVPLGLLRKELAKQDLLPMKKFVSATMRAVRGGDYQVIFETPDGLRKLISFDVMPTGLEIHYIKSA